MPPGTRLPAHRHDEGFEECLVLEGEVIVNDERYRAGDYVLAPQGSEHYDVRSDVGALFFLRSPSTRPGGARAAAG
jgi:anti-sigma factor ChrR (cupin superfamily)